MPSRCRWILVAAGATAFDLLARFAAPFNFARVMHVEALLFLLTAVVFGVLLRAEPREQGWRRATKVGLIWLFALGGLRSVLWTVGTPLMWANIATFVPALVGVLIWLIRRRQVRGGDHSRGAA